MTKKSSNKKSVTQSAGHTETRPMNKTNVSAK